MRIQLQKTSECQIPIGLKDFSLSPSSPPPLFSHLKITQKKLLARLDISSSVSIFQVFRRHSGHL